MAIALVGSLCAAASGEEVVLYSNEFAGDERESIAEAASVGGDLAHEIVFIKMDGSGLLVPTAPDDMDSLSAESSRLSVDFGTELNEGTFSEFQITARLTAPRFEWIGIGFAEGPRQIGGSGGPWLEMRPAGSRHSLWGGRGSGGSQRALPSSLQPGEPVDFEMTYHADNTVSVALNDIFLFEREPVQYSLNNGIPVIRRFTLQFRRQLTDGSAHVENITVTATP